MPTIAYGEWKQIALTSILPIPTLTSAAVSPVMALFSVSVSFTKPVTGFVIGDITVVGGSASNFAGSGDSYTFDVNPTFGTASLVTVSIAASVCVDADANPNRASNTLAYVVPLFHDSFTDTNGTSLDAHSPDWGGGSWSEIAGDWSINTNRALTTSVALARSLNPMGFQPSSLEINMRSGAGAFQAGLIFRCVDSANFWLVDIHDTLNLFRLYEVTAGAFTLQDSDSIAIDGNTFYTVVVTDDGTNMAASLDGTPRLSYSSTNKNTGQNIGLYTTLNASSRFEYVTVFG